MAAHGDQLRDDGEGQATAGAFDARGAGDARPETDLRGELIIKEQLCALLADLLLWAKIFEARQKQT